MPGFIYGIQALEPTEMVYVGLTRKTPEERYANHRRGTHNKALAQIIETRPTRVIVLQRCLTKEELVEAEIGWIAHYQEAGAPLTNKSPGGCVLPEEAIEAIAEKAKQRWADPEYRERVGKAISETMTGRTLPKEHAKHLAEAVRAHYASPAGEKHRHLVSAALQEYAEEIGARIQGCWGDPEYRAAIQDKKLIDRPCRYCGHVCSGYEMMAHVRWHCPDAPIAKDREVRQRDYSKRMQEVNNDPTVRSKSHLATLKKRPCKHGCGFVGTGYQMSTHIRYHCPNAPGKTI